MTLQEYMNLRLRLGAEEFASSIIAEMIKSDKNSPEKEVMRQGSGYYNFKHDILNRKITYYTGKQKKEDHTRTNHKLVHPFHRRLVNEKVDYFLGTPMTWASEDEAALGVVSDVLGEDIQDKFTKAVVGASNEGVNWLHPYRDEQGELLWTVIPAFSVFRFGRPVTRRCCWP